MNKHSFLFFLTFLIFYPQANLVAQSTDRLEYTFPHGDEVRGAVWSPDGSRIMSWSDDDTGYVWNSAMGIQLFTFVHGGTNGSFRGPSFSPDGNWILSFKDDFVYVWDGATGENRYTLKQVDDLNSAIWSPAGDYIFVWGTSLSYPNNTLETGFFIQIWNVSNGKQQTIIQLSNAGFLSGVEPNRDGTRFVTFTLGDGGGIHVWDTMSGNEITALRQTGSSSLSESDVVWSADNQHMLYSGINGIAFVVNASSGEHEMDLLDDGWISSVYLSPDQTRMAGLLQTNRRVPIWDAQTGKELTTLHHAYFVQSVTWSKDGSHILTSSTDGINAWITLWDIQSGDVLLEFEHEDGSGSAFWNSDETRILGWFANPFSSKEDGTFFVWDAATGEELLTDVHNGVVSILYPPVWSPQGSRLLSWRGSQVFVWNLG